MNTEFIAQRKSDLLKRKTELEEELKTFAKKDSESKDNWQTELPQMNASEEDKADEVEEYENLLPVEYVLENNLKDINTALGKIEEGKYGICEKCNKEIDEGRLIVLPEAKNCTNCDK